MKLSSGTTKIRPVFDASARAANVPSLNLCLETGPNLIELIPSILQRFRVKQIGVISDIRRAFLQISITPEERDYLHFLWKRKGELITFRHKRVVFGVTCSPFLLGATIQLHLKNVLNGFINVSVSPGTLQKMNECFYSDNCVNSVDSKEDLLLFMDEATRVMQTAGFDLRQWEYTNDGQTDKTTVLGVVWNKKSDFLNVNLSFLKDFNFDPLTKRVMLSIAQRIFDPIGFTCPVMLYPKLLIQQSWKENIDWDEELNSATRIEFLKWLNDLHILENVKIPRKIGNVNDNSFHAFSDASGLAYAAAVFIRIENSINDVEVQLIGAKTRVAPTKDVTIPRLELLAATITARLAHSLIAALQYENAEVVYWTDSTTVLSWINREAQWAIFVWNRIQEIKALRKQFGATCLAFKIRRVCLQEAAPCLNF